MFWNHPYGLELPLTYFAHPPLMRDDHSGNPIPGQVLLAYCPGPKECLSHCMVMAWGQCQQCSLKYQTNIS